MTNRILIHRTGQAWVAENDVSATLSIGDRSYTAAPSTPVNIG